jgi:hypothetical protein
MAKFIVSAMMAILVTIITVSFPGAQSGGGEPREKFKNRIKTYSHA